MVGFPKLPVILGIVLFELQIEAFEVCRSCELHEFASENRYFGVASKAFQIAIIHEINGQLDLHH